MAADTQYGGFWQRLLALICDSFILMAITYAVAGVMVQIGMDLLGGLYQLVSIVIVLAYYVGMQSSGTQATVGKMLLGLKVASADGERASALLILGRELAKIVSWIPLGIGFLLAAFTSRKQALHDMIASTVVLKVAPAKVLLGAVVVVASAAAAGVLFTTFVASAFMASMQGAMAQMSGTQRMPPMQASAKPVQPKVASIPPASARANKTEAPVPLATPVAATAVPAPAPQSAVAPAPEPRPAPAEPKLAPVPVAKAAQPALALPGAIQVRTIELPGALEPLPPRAGPKYNDLMSAVMSGDGAGVNELLALGKWVDKPDSKGMTPLAAAALRGDQANAERLLKAGADAYPALLIARERRDEAMTSLLERYLATSKRP